MDTSERRERHAVGPMERAATLLGVLLPMLAVATGAVLTWENLTTGRDIAIFAGMYVATSLGLTVGFHRMLTHRSFQARPAVRFVLLALGCMAGMADPVRWAAIHIEHHAHSDDDADPHSPVRGFFHAHMGWFLPGYPDDPDTYAPRLRDDRMVRFFQRTFWYWAALSFAVPFALGGWTGLLWGGWIRLFFTLHVTFAVNSICHTFGRAEFATGDRSRNNWLMGVFAFGEGWHNNHHAFPSSAMHGLYWWQVDLSGYVILGLERLRLGSHVRRVPPELRARRRLVAKAPP